MKGRILKMLVFLLMFGQKGYAQTGDSIFVMFWNVENYFDTSNNEFTADDEFTPWGEKRWSKRKFLAKRNNIARTIIASRGEYGKYPTVVGLAEVENRWVLQTLVEDTPLAKLGYKVVHRDSPDARGIDVALIYREEHFQIVEQYSYTVRLPDSTRTTRSILYVKGYSKDIKDTVHLFINHWPSKLGGEKASRPNRMAAAKRVQSLVEDKRKEANGREISIVLMGDFNDTPDSESIGAFETMNLNNLSVELYKEGRGTIRYQGEWELIDQFIVSKSLTDVKMEIFAPPFLLEQDLKYLGFKPYRTYSGPKYLGGISDHLPIILEIAKNRKNKLNL